MHIQFFGNFTVVHTKQERAVQFQTRKTSTLFAYLAAHADTTFSRTQIATLLWGDYPDKAARRSLTMSLSRLKKAFEQSGLSNPAIVTRNTIQFPRSNTISSDLYRFNDLWVRCEQTERSLWSTRGKVVAHLTEAVDLYRGSLLQGMSLPDSIEFDMWITLQRQTYHERVLLALETITAFHLVQQDWAQAEQYAKRQLALENWHEKAHQQLIQLYMATDRPDAATAQYERCKQILWDEFGVEPSVLTQQVRSAGHRPKQQHIVQPTASDQTNRTKHNLPVAHTPFIGREDELARLQALVGERTYRLITLVGHGGAGKTRLSMALARSQLPYFADGVFFVSLVSLTSAENIPGTIGRALNLTFSSNQPPLAQLTQYLRERELLLVLDNIEHLLNDEATIDLVLELFTAAPEIVLVVTSRSQLWVRAETIFPLGGLTYPADDQACDSAENARTFDAIQLFEERCQRLRPDFSLSDNLTCVQQICQLVDGSPLGIELAATQVGMADCHTVAAALNISLQTLATRMRDMPARQRSIAAVFDYTWQLLSPVHQRLLAQLSVFRDGFALAQLSTVVPTIEPEQLKLLERHSLLRQEENGRYSLHEMIRQFAAERLGSAEKQQLEAAYLRSYLSHLASQQATLEGAKPHLSASALLPDLNNIQNAWQLALDHHQFEPMQAATQSLSNLLLLHNLHHLGHDMFRAAVDFIQPQTGKIASTRKALAHLQAEGGRFLIRLSQFKKAKRWAKAAIDEARQIDDVWAIGNAANVSAEASWRTGHYSTACIILDEYQTHIYASKSQRLIGSYHYNHGVIHRMSAEHNGAHQHSRRALSIWQEIGHVRFEAVTYNELGVLEEDCANLQKATSYYKNALRLNESISNHYEAAQNRMNIANIQSASGHNRHALELTYDVLAYYQNSGSMAKIGWSLNNIGYLHYLLGEHEQGISQLDKALEIAQQCAERRLSLFALGNLGEVAMSQKRLTDARQHFLEAMAVHKQYDGAFDTTLFEQNLRLLNGMI